MNTAHTASWEKKRQAAYDAGMHDFENELPCSKQEYMLNDELAEQWLAGWNDARLSNKSEDIEG